MSGIFNVVGGKVAMTTTLPVPAYGDGGKIYDASGALYVADSSAVVSWANGCAFGSGGAMLIYDASVSGLPLGTVFQNDLPFYNNGMCVDVLNAGTVVSGGTPFAGSGAVAAVGGGAGFSLTTSFFAPLKTSLVPQVAAGSPTPTFTRATPAYVADCDGVLRQAVSGEARFAGARRVRNYLISSEIANAAWNVIGTATKTNGFLDPFGGITASKITCTSYGPASALNSSTSIAVGEKNTIHSMWLRGEIGGEQVTFHNGNSLNNIFILTTEWKRYLCGPELAAQYPTVYFANTPGTFYAAAAQAEDVSGSPNPAPSEYVSVGVLAAPWHGAGVDGVKYFPTTNGNSVSGNVVTAGSGTAIPDATMKGYYCEGARTNLALQSQTFDNAAWGKSTASITADQTTAPDGTTTADKLLEDGTFGPHSIYQGVAVAAVPHTISFYAKYFGRQWIAVAFAATPTNFSYFDIQNGIAGTLGSGHTSTIVAAGNGWFRCSITLTPPAITWYLSLSTAASDGNIAATGDLTKGIYLWGAQVEAAPFASSYIPTTTAAATRNGDVLTYPSAGNVSDATGSLYYEFTSNSWPNTAGKWPLAFASSGTPVTLRFGGGGLTMYDGVTEADGPAFTASGTVKHAGSYSSAGGMKPSSNGLLGVGAAFDGSMNATSLAIGCLIGGTNQADGNIRNVRIYPAALSDAQLVGITT